MMNTSFLQQINIAELILGALIGILLTEIYEKFLVKSIKQLQVTALVNRRRRLYNDQKVRKFIFEYYETKGIISELFDCIIQGYCEKILLITNSAWINLNVDIFREPTILTMVQGRALAYKTNDHMIEKRKKAGQNLYNGKALYLSRSIDIAKLEVKECTFFQKLTLIDQIENETLKNSTINCFATTKIRDLTLKNFAVAISPRNLPISIGCHVVFAIKRSGKYFVALHKRSESTFTYGGSIASIPVFGMVPIPYNTTTVKDGISNNILLFNILKEYCEELYDEKVLEKGNDHANPFWFYEELHEARELLNSLQERKSYCQLLGYGFDAINGLSILAVLLCINDEEYAENVYNHVKANWEVDNKEIMFFDVHDSMLKDYFKELRYQNGTAFALSLALNKLNCL